MMSKKLVKIKELKAKYPQEYDKAYQKFCSMQWDCPVEESGYIEDLQEANKWLLVNNIHYSVGHCQSDDAYFTGRVRLDLFLEAFDTENEYFVLREAMKLRDCDTWFDIETGRRSAYAGFGEIEWQNDNADFVDEDAVVKSYGPCRSILEGMSYHEYYDTCMNLLGDLETWVKGKCENMFKDLYYKLRDDIDDQMSEESFEEWAESMDEEFEVYEEIDDEGDTEEGTPECGGTVSTDEVSRLAA